MTLPIAFGLQINQCLSDDTRKTFVSVLQAQLASYSTTLAKLNPAYANVIPKDVTVASQCINGNERLGIWLGAVGTAQQTADLQNFSVLDPSEETALAWTAAGIQQVFVSVLSALRVSANNNRIDSGGTPDKSGPIEITSVTPSLVSPTSSKVVIGGEYYLTSLISFSFSATITDTWPTAAPFIPPVTVVSKPSFDEKAIKTIEAFTDIAALGVAVTAGAGLTTYLYDTISSAIAGAHVPATGIGFIASQLFVNQILLPKTTTKLVFTYDKIVVDPKRGLIAECPYPPLTVARAPAVDLTGPTSAIGGDDKPGATRPIYTATTTDMLSPAFTWPPVKGLTMTLQPSSDSTVSRALFEPSPALAAGKTQDYKIVVNVVDGDNRATATATLTVNIDGMLVTPVGLPVIPKPIHPV